MGSRQQVILKRERTQQRDSNLKDYLAQGSRITDPDAMLRDIDSHLAGYSTEMREELRQEIALAVVSCTQIDGRIVTADSNARNREGDSAPAL